MKKYIALFIMLSIIISFPMCPSVYAANPEIILNEYFDNYDVNETKISGLTVKSGIDTRVVSRNGSDKALYSKAWGNDINYNYSILANNPKLVLSFEIMRLGKNTQGEITVQDKRGNKLVIAQLDEGLALQDGKRYGGLINNKWSKFDYVFDFANKYISIYKDGRCLVDRWIYSAFSNLNDLLSLDIYVSADDNSEITEVYLDNLQVYTGNAPQKISGLVTREISVEELPFEPTIEIPKISDKAFWDYTMDSQPPGTGLQLNDGMIKCDSEDENDDNGVMLLSTPADSAKELFVDFYTNYGDWKATFERCNMLVYEVDVKVLKLGRSIDVLRFIGGGDYRPGIHIATDGSISYNGVALGKIGVKEWHKFSIARDFRNNKTNIYVDKKLIAEGIYTDYPGGITGWRFQTEDTTGGDVEWYIDNMRVYEGFEYRDFSSDDEDEPNVAGILTDFVPDLETSDDAFEVLGSDNVAIMMSNGAIASNGKKTFADVKPYIEDGVTMIPLRAVSEAFGEKVIWDETTQTVNIGEKASMTIGNTIMMVNGNEIQLKKSPVIKDSRTFIPMRDLCENVLGRNVYWDDRGFAVISKKPIELSNDPKVMLIHEPSDILYRFLLADRPSGDEVIAKLKENMPRNTHPRILGGADIAKELKDKIDKYPECREMANEIIKSADASLSVELPSFEPSNLQTTLRTFAETRMVNLAFSYLITGDEKYAERAWEEMQAVLKFPTWFTDAALQVSAGCLGVAIGYDTFYDYLTEEQKSFIRKNATKLGLEYGILSFKGEWTQATQWWRRDAYANFNAIGNGGLLTLALVMADEEDTYEICKHIIECTIQSYEYFVGLFYPDGGYYESMTYENYGTEYMYYGLGTLLNTTGSVYGLLDAKGIRDIADAYLYLQGPAAGAFNFAHGGSGLHLSTAIYWIANIYNDREAVTALRQLTKSMGREVLPRIELYKPEMYLETTNFPLDGYLEVVGTGGMRSNYIDKTGIFAGVHGGFTGIDHDQVDSGSFVFEANGVRWATDLGADDYSLPGFWGAEGGLIYRESPQGNNCFVINPRRGYSGQEDPAYAPVTKFESKPKGAYIVYDLSDCYRKDANFAQRGFMLSDDRRTFTIRDEIELKGESDIYWFMHTDSDIEIKGKTAILTTSGKELIVDVSSDADSYEVLSMPSAPLPKTIGIGGEADDSGKSKVAIKLHGNGKINITVKLIPVLGNEEDVVSAKDVSPISEWFIEEGEIPVRPKLESLSINGVSLETFEPDAYIYTKKYLDGSLDGIPILEATSSQGNVEIVQPKSINDKGKIIVRDRNNADLFTTYQVAFEVLEKKNFDKKYNKLPAFEITSSGIMDTTIPNNAYDMDLGTSFTMAGIGTAWLCVDLGEELTFDAIAVAPLFGNQRKTSFAIEISNDGVNFTEIYNGDSSGRTNDFEILELKGTSRFIRFVGYGNSEGSPYCSLADLAVLQSK